MRRTKLLGLIAGTILLSACASTSNDAGPDAADTGSSPLETPGSDGGGSGSGGAKAARWEGLDFTIETFDGGTFKLSAQAGTPVVINFWESW
jgi:hypothetical protein